MKTLFVGRFQPFHLGHLHAIKRIVEEYGSVAIAIGSSNLSREEQNPFTAGERKTMIVAALGREKNFRGKYRVFLLPDFFDDRKWRENVLRKTKFDVVVTGSSWVARCLRGWKKIARPKFLRRRELSSTHIRKLILEGRKSEWKKLVPKKVAAIIEKIGAEKTIRNANGVKH